MAKKQSVAKRMINKGMRKAEMPKTVNGPGGKQMPNFMKIEKNPIVGGPAKLTEHGKGALPTTRK